MDSGREQSLTLGGVSWLAIRNVPIRLVNAGRKKVATTAVHFVKELVKLPISNAAAVIRGVKLKPSYRLLIL
jgi:hypothetical protein